MQASPIVDETWDSTLAVRGPCRQEDTIMEIIRVAEIERRYPDEWVLLEITRDHKDHRRVAGRLLAHSPDRTALDEPYSRFRAEHPRARLYQFYTGDVLAKDVTVVL